MNNDIITEQTLSMKEQLPESQGMLEATTESTKTGEWVKYVEKPQAIDIDDSVDQGDLQTVGDSSLKKDSGSSGYPSSGSESCVPNEITIDSTAEPSKI
ncbi:hypothetical protein CEXT_750771 [Caerostris extrusa]|uniref:Uncharacterized protein n=1 Tax=Caerostris extrusa TaxID=172846 RepID=A0AAV4WVV6_CAEEX|nr:hypothetical protein CEXT_750771 [Caerostris extrusa]